MGEEEPETEDGLGKDIEDSVCDNLGIDIDIARSISNTPDARKCQRVASTEEARAYIG